MSKLTVMVCDTQVESLASLVDVLENKLNFNVIALSDSSNIEKKLASNELGVAEVLLLDVASNNASSLALLQRLRAKLPHFPVIALTNYGDVAQAMGAIEFGAMDYLARPVSHYRLKTSLNNAIRQYHLASQAFSTLAQQMGVDGKEALGGVPPAYIEQMSLGLATRQDGPLLVLGEKGTGKSQISRHIHLQSARACASFDVLSAEIVSSKLIEEKLSFALLQAANLENLKCEELSPELLSLLGGTLYIGGIDKLSHSFQQKLVQLMIKLSNVTPVRGSRMLSGVRLMVGSNLSLDELRSERLLDPKLMDYLTAQLVEVKPLRSMKHSIAPIASYYAKYFSMQKNTNVRDISASAAEILEQYNWPVNLMELQHLIYRAIMSSEGALLDVEHVAKYLPNCLIKGEVKVDRQEEIMTSKRVPLTTQKGEVRRLRDLEADTINFALKFYDGRISEVARKLGIGRSTLYRKLDEFDIKVA